MEGDLEFDPGASALFAGLLALRDRGEPGDVEELCQRHPKHAVELRRLEERWKQLGPFLSAGATLHERIVSCFGDGADPEISLTASAEPLDQPAALDPLRRDEPGRYRYEEEIDAGGQGEVLRVWDRDLRRPLAMKVLREGSVVPAAAPRRDSRALRRFLEEARITSQLDHPGIVPVHEMGIDAAGRAYFTMKLVQGRDLRAIFDLVRRGSEGWSLARALNVLLRVCEAVAFAHSRNVVHRDLKPANVMVGRFGEVHVMDWGLAKVVAGEGESDAASTAAGRSDEIVGTPAYMAPEQARGEPVDPRADVYSIGAMLYHLLAGHRPYAESGDSPAPHALLRQVRESPPAPLSRHCAAPELIAICERSMERSPAQRYANAEDLAEDLRAFLETRVVRAHRTGPLAELRKWTARNRALVMTGAAACVALVGVVLVGSRIYAKRVEESEGLVAQNETVVRAVDSARNGAWKRVIEQVGAAPDTATEAGWRLKLLAADAWIALDEREAAARSLEAMLPAAPADVRGAVEVRLGAQLLLDPSTEAEGLAVLQQSLARDVSSADRALAEALQAETVPEALRQLRLAAQRQPDHSLAQATLLTTLVLAGRIEEADAQARVFTQFFPEDPRGRLVSGLLDVLLDRSNADELAALPVERLDAKNAERFRLLMHTLEQFRAGMTFECWLGEPIGCAETDERGFLQSLQERARVDGPAFLGLLSPRVPAVRALWLTWADGFEALTGGRVPEAEQLFQTSIELDPENGLGHYLLASTMMTREADVPADYAAKMRAAMQEFDSAIDLPIVFPEMARAAETYAYRAAVILSASKNVPGMTEVLERARTRPSALERKHPPSQYELTFLLGEVAERLHDGPLAGALLFELERHFPELDTRMSRANVCVLRGDWCNAVDAAETILASEPKNEDALALREQALKGIDEWFAAR